MWERIGASSGIIIGAVVLFVIVVVALFLIERAGEKKPRRRRKALYLVPKQKHIAANSPARTHANTQYARKCNACSAEKNIRGISAKKIV